MDHWLSFAIGAFDEVGNGKKFFLIFFHVLHRLESVALAVSCIPTRSLITERDTSLFMFPLYSKERPERNIARMWDSEGREKRNVFSSTLSVQPHPAESLSWTIISLRRRVQIISRKLIIS